MQRKKRILFDIAPYVTGGTERFLFTLLHHLDRSKYTPVLLSWGEGENTRLAKKYGLEFYIIPFQSSIGEKQRLQDFLSKKRIDLIQSNYFSISLAETAAKLKINHIWRVGGHVEIVCNDQSDQFKKTFISIMCLLSERVICPTRFLASQITNLGYSRVDRINNAVDTFRLDGLFRSISRFSPQNSSLKVAMVAHLVPPKRHEDFIRAAFILKRRGLKARYYIFGSPYVEGPWKSHAQVIQREIQRLGLEKDTSICSVNNDRFEIFKTMSMKVLPSLHEGASNALIESMALGVPVIATDSGSNRELIKDKETGLIVPPLDPDTLATSIAELAEDKDLRHFLSRNAKCAASNHFNIWDTVRAYEKTYSSCS